MTFPEFQRSCDAVLMGRTTFEPALGSDRWPWPDPDVFVLGSHRPDGTPDHVVVESDPERLVARVPEANRGGDVHVVGGPRTIETLRSLGALDKLGLVARDRPAPGGRLIIYMETTTIRVMSKTRDRLNALARRRGIAAGQLVDQLVRDADEDALLESAEHAWGRMATESDLLAAYRDESAQLEGFGSPLPED